MKCTVRVFGYDWRSNSREFKICYEPTANESVSRLIISGRTFTYYVEITRNYENRPGYIITSTWTSIEFTRRSLLFFIFFVNFLSFVADDRVRFAVYTQFFIYVSFESLRQRPLYFNTVDNNFKNTTRRVQIRNYTFVVELNF